MGILGPSYALGRLIQRLVAAGGDPGAVTPAQLRMIAVTPAVELAVAATVAGLSMAAVDAAVQIAVAANVPGLSVAAVNATGAAGEDTPLVVMGANCVQWCRSDLGITQSGGFVSTWADQSASGANYSQASGPAQPAYSGTLNGHTGLLFDGVDDVLSSTLSLSNPQAFWAVLETLSWTSTDSLTGGTGASQLRIRQVGASPQINVINGVTSSNNNNLPAAGGARLVEVLCNNTTSDELRVGSVVTTGTAIGTNSSTVRQLGASTSTQFAHIRVWEIAYFNALPNSTQRTAMRNYAIARYGSVINT